MKSIKSLLKEASNGILSDELLGKIEKLFVESVDTAANAKVDAAVASAIERNDTENVALFEEAFAKLDEERTKKLTHLLALSEKTKEVALKREREKHITFLNEDATRFKKTLIKSMDLFLETAIDEAIPVELIKEAALNTQARQLVKHLRETLAIDQGLAMKSVKDVIDGAQSKVIATESIVIEKDKVIAEKDAELKRVNESITGIKAAKNNAELKLVIEQKLSGADAKKKIHFRKILEGKDATYVAEQFEFLSKAYDKELSLVIEGVRENALKNAKGNMRIPSNTALVNESKRTDNPVKAVHQDVEKYVEELRRQGIQS